MINIGLIDRAGKVFEIENHIISWGKTVNASRLILLGSYLYASDSFQEKDKLVDCCLILGENYWQKERSKNILVNTLKAKMQDKKQISYNISKQEAFEFIYYNYMENFARFRLNSLTNTPRNCLSDELYIKIASSNFNWFDIIWKFVLDNKKDIKDVTITRERIGYKENEFGYYEIKGKRLEHIDPEEFITLSGNPVINTNFTLLTEDVYFNRKQPEKFAKLNSEGVQKIMETENKKIFEIRERKPLTEEEIAARKAKMEERKKEIEARRAKFQEMMKKRHAEMEARRENHHKENK